MGTHDRLVPESMTSGHMHVIKLQEPLRIDIAVLLLSSWRWELITSDVALRFANHELDLCLRILKLICRGVCFGDMGLNWDGLLWGFTKANTIV